MIDDVGQPVLIDIEEPPPPQAETQVGKAKEEEGAAGKKAEPTPVVAPEPKIVVPAKPPVVAAPIAGMGASSNAGAALAGTGPGAGGAGGRAPDDRAAGRGYGQPALKRFRKQLKSRTLRTGAAVLASQLA